MSITSRFAWVQRLPFSREGLLWLMIAVAMLVTGLFKGINLITLLACWLIVLTALNWWLARRQLLHLHAQRSIPDLIFAGTPFRWSVKLKNLGRKPAHSVTVREDPVPQAWFAAEVPPHKAIRLETETVLSRRGIVPCPSIRLTCGYPVGLAQLHRGIAADEPVLVAPRLGRLQRGVFRHWLSQHCPGLGLVRAAAHRHPAAHSEFHGLRSFRAGDSPRHIHWRTTARRGELMVREFEDWPNDNLVLLVDGWAPADAAADPDPVFERMLSFAATVVWEWCRQKGDDFALGIAADEAAIVQGTTGQPLAIKALHGLAAARGGPDADFARLLDVLEETPLPAAPVVVATLRGGLADAVQLRWHRPVAEINIAAGQERDFFE
jgi:uncharacterized protein (DUF58 family)